MGEKKEFKMSLGTMVLLIIIFILIVALGVVYYLGFIKYTERIANSENTGNKDGMQITNIVNNDNNEEIDTENNVPNSDLVVSTNDLYAYIENGILYYTEEVTNGNYSKDKMIKDTQLSNIKRMKLYNIGTAVNPVLFFITEDGQVYTMRYYFSHKIEKYEGLKDYKVEDILSHTGEMYDVFEVLLKDGTRKTVNVYENGETGEEVKGVEKIDPNKDLVYTDYNNNSFSIPKINMNTQDVISINNEIEKIITEVKKDVQDGVRGNYYGIDYKSYTNGEVLSVVINKYSDNDYVDYSVYNVSVKTGKRFTNEELISVKGFSSNAFVNKLPELYKKKYMEDFNITENELNSSFHSDTYNKTVAKENYGVNEPMFLDGNGNINVVAKIYKLVGGIPPYSEIIIVK